MYRLFRYRGYHYHDSKLRRLLPPKGAKPPSRRPRAKGPQGAEHPSLNDKKESKNRQKNSYYRAAARKIMLFFIWNNTISVQKRQNPLGNNNQKVAFCLEFIQLPYVHISRYDYMDAFPTENNPNKNTSQTAAGLYVSFKVYSLQTKSRSVCCDAGTDFNNPCHPCHRPLLVLPSRPLGVPLQQPRLLSSMKRHCIWNAKERPLA